MAGVGFLLESVIFLLKAINWEIPSFLGMLLVPGCLVPKKTPVVILQHDWNSGSVLLESLKTVFILTRYTLTPKVFKTLSQVLSMLGF